MRLVHAAILQTHPVPDLCLRAAIDCQVSHSPQMLSPMAQRVTPTRAQYAPMATQALLLCTAATGGFGLHKRALRTKGERLSSGSRTLNLHVLLALQSQMVHLGVFYKRSLP
jgi:hypothetical protein